jgi:hypothetical protein
MRAADIAIIVLIVAAAVIHLDRALLNPHIRVLFVLNALGYLSLLVLLYLPRLPRQPIRRVLIGYAALTFVLFFVWGIMKGEWPLIGFVDKAAEALLIVLLLDEDRHDHVRPVDSVAEGKA